MKKLPFFSSLLLVLMVSCGPKPEEQVKDFALKFGDFVNTNQKDSIQKYYPAFELTDSLNSVSVGDVIVEQGEKEGSYIVKYSTDISLFIALGKDGKINVEQSKGLLSVDPKGLNLVKEANLWNENLKDKELKELVVEQIRQDSINNASAGLTFQMFCKPENVEGVNLQSFQTLKQIKINLEEIGFSQTGTQTKREKDYDWTPDMPTYYTKTITNFSKTIGKNTTNVTIGGADGYVSEAKIEFPKPEDVTEFKSTVKGKLKDSKVYWHELYVNYKGNNVEILAGGGE